MEAIARPVEGLASSPLRVGVIVAASREAAAVRRVLGLHQRRRRLASGRCWEGKPGIFAVVAVVRAGIGPARAEAAVREALRALRPNVLLSLGFAGALRSGIPPGTLLLAEGTHLEGLVGWPADPKLLDAGRAACASAGIACLVENLVTVPSLAATPQAKAALGAATGAAAADMEAAAVAAVAAVAGLPFLAAKVIFDAADEVLHPVLMDVVWPDGSPRLLRAARLAARDAEVRAALHWASRRSRLAATVLTRLCRALLPILGAGDRAPGSRGIAD